MYHVTDLTSRPELWDSFVKRSLYTVFVQSSLYGEFYQRLGEQHVIVGVFKGENLVGGALAVTTHARRGSFLFIPYGPILPEEGRTDVCNLLMGRLEDIAMARRLHFVRASPFLQDTADTQELFAKRGYIRAPLHSLAETTWLLSLDADDQALLFGMKKNHRNLINRCLRDGVRVSVETRPGSLEQFHEIHDVTAARHKFTRFSRDYIDKEFTVFSSAGSAAIVCGYLPDGRLDSAAIIMYYGTMACYRHGASLNLDARLPTSYAVQWAAIREARRRVMRWYNFWGIAPDGSSKHHPFRGITHFKTGFGGEAKHLLPAMDKPLSWRYRVTKLFEYGRKLKRGF